MGNRAPKKQPDLLGSLLLPATGIVALALYVRRTRQSQRAAALSDADNEAKVDRGEVTEDEGFLLAIRQRGRSAVKKSAEESVNVHRRLRCDNSVHGAVPAQRLFPALG